MDDVILHTRTDQPVFSGQWGPKLQWGRRRFTWLQLEFKQGELFPQKEKNHSGIKTFFKQTSFIGEGDLGYIFVADDSNLWSKLPTIGQAGKETSKSFFGGEQASFWGL